MAVGEINAAGDAGDAFLSQHFLLLLEPVGVAGERAVGTDNAMAGTRRGKWILVHGVADGAVAPTAQEVGDIGIGSDFAGGNPRCQRQTF